jgi:hypothetical protein
MPGDGGTIFGAFFRPYYNMKDADDETLSRFSGYGGEAAEEARQEEGPAVDREAVTTISGQLQRFPP